MRRCCRWNLRHREGHSPRSGVGRSQCRRLLAIQAIRRNLADCLEATRQQNSPHHLRRPRPRLPPTPPRCRPLLLRPHRHPRQLRRNHETCPHSRLFRRVVAKHNEREPQRHTQGLSDLRRNHAPAEKGQDHQHRLALDLRRLSRGRRLRRQQSRRRRSHPFARSRMGSPRHLRQRHRPRHLPHRSQPRTPRLTARQRTHHQNPDGPLWYRG